MRDKHKIFRKSFANRTDFLPLVDFSKFYKQSFDRFFQNDANPDERKNFGLQAAFNSCFPIINEQNNIKISFVKYNLESPDVEPYECLEHGLTYASKLIVTLRLETITFNTNNIQENKNVTPSKQELILNQAKEYEIDFGNIPLITNNGFFIFKGNKNVLLSYLRRTPGIYYNVKPSKNVNSSKVTCNAKIVPLKGSILTFNFDCDDKIYLKISEISYKFPVTLIFKGLGYSEKFILDYFYDKDILKFKDNRYYRKLPSAYHFLGAPIRFNLKNLFFYSALSPNESRISGKYKKPLPFDEFLVKHNDYCDIIQPHHIKIMSDRGITELPVLPEDFIGRYAADNIINPKTGKILLKLNEPLTEKILNEIRMAGVKQVPFLFINDKITPMKLRASSSIRDTLEDDGVRHSTDALWEIFGTDVFSKTGHDFQDPQSFFFNLFFNPELYDLSVDGRKSLSERLYKNKNINISKSFHHPGVNVLRPEDFLETVKELIRLKDSGERLNELEDVSGVKIISIFDILQNNFNFSLQNVKKYIQDCFSEYDILSESSLNDLISSKDISNLFLKFFETKSYFQPADQVNPLAEILHSVDINHIFSDYIVKGNIFSFLTSRLYSFYDHISPLYLSSDNVGRLRFSPSLYARVNDNGFLETPLRVVENGKVTGLIKYLSVDDETDQAIAEASAPIDINGYLSQDEIYCRINGEPRVVKKDQIKYLDFSPNQFLGTSSALIPFLEHTDPTLALKAGNLMRLAVPLLLPEAPLVGAGLESKVALGNNLQAESDGIVEDVDASRIIMRYVSENDENPGEYLKTHKLIKFRMTNNSTCYNQRPAVVSGERVLKGDILANGPSSDKGELALGRNVMAAVMPWEGYNFKDAIIVSERLVREDVFTSVHIKVLEISAHATEAGPEEITKDIPDVSSDYAERLDNLGIIRVGSYVKTGDIIVGCVTPKKGPLSLVDQLVHIVFGSDAKDCINTSLLVPIGVEGIVTKVQVFCGTTLLSNQDLLNFQKYDLYRLNKEFRDEENVISKQFIPKLFPFLVGKTLSKKFLFGNKTFTLTEILTEERLLKIDPIYWLNEISDINEILEISAECESLILEHQEVIKKIRKRAEEKKSKILKSITLTDGIITKVKVFVAAKKKLSVGDILCTRHGDAGVVSLILPEHDMPFSEDGSPVDVILNPLSIFGKLNVGLIFETHLGLASKTLGDMVGTMLGAKNFVGLEELLKQTLGNDVYDKHFSNISINKFSELCENYRNGFLMSSPAFDGASEEDIRDIFRIASLPATGQIILRDGRTGDSFDSPITAGVVYMMKLCHTADSVLEARSYNDIDDSKRLGSQYLFPGQMVSEDEIWALVSKGAAHNVLELSLVKTSDFDWSYYTYHELLFRFKDKISPFLPQTLIPLLATLRCLGLNLEISDKFFDYE